MAEALIAKLKGDQIIASDIDPERLSYLKRKYKIKTTKSNLDAFEHAETVILAIKPQHMAEALESLKTRKLGKKKKLVISIAAGIPLKYIEHKLPGNECLRAMPNNACLIGEGITALTSGNRVANKIFKTVGEVVEIQEEYFDVVTGLSGSGPAYVYRFIRALVNAGIVNGLKEEIARKLALQTVLGSAKTAKESKMDLEKLCEMVASPGGTTIEGLKVLDELGLEEMMSKAVQKASEKSKVLSEKWAI